MEPPHKNNKLVSRLFLNHEKRFQHRPIISQFHHASGEGKNNQNKQKTSRKVNHREELFFTARLFTTKRGFYGFQLMWKQQTRPINKTGWGLSGVVLQVEATR